MTAGLSAAIEFRDCSLDRALAHHDGRMVALHELADLCAERAARTGAAIEIGPMPDFHPLAQWRPARWERALQLAIFATSGQVARRDELLHGREILRQLPRATRVAIDAATVLGVLAPMLTGFRFSAGATFVHEANRHRDAAAVLTRLQSERALAIEIPLCAHRERPSVARAGLAAGPWPLFVDRVGGLLAGLLGNAAVERAAVRFISQGPSERAASCMFPEVFLAYAGRGRTGELLRLLAAHQHTLASQLEPACGAKVGFDVGSIDALSAAAEDELEAGYGGAWQSVDEAAALSGPLSSTVAGRAAIRGAAQHVARLMPEIGRLSAVDVERIDTPAGAAVAWFARRASMSLHGRALFEVAFYRQWALRARSRGAIGLGFDRDFSPFQRLAWQSAFEVDPDDAVPLLYARRTTDTRAGGSLGELSFRQFWVAPSDEARQVEAA